MMVPFSGAFIIAIGSALAVSAQSPAWGQCGGTGWSGDTTCVSGSTCVVQNAYYSQCVPGGSTGGSTTSKPPTSTSVGQPAPTSGGPNFWFSFGDSYTQTGFNPSSSLPNTRNPIGNPNYPGNTAVGGENWIDYDTTKYNKSLVYTYNFAFGGATIDRNLVAPVSSGILTLTDQVNQFLNGFASKPASTPWTSSNAVFSIWIGINDLGNSYWNGNVPAGSSLDNLLNAEFSLVQKLYNAGARNFLFINVPPTDRSPLFLGQSTSGRATLNSAISGFNSRLATKAFQFKSSNSGVTTYLYDSNAGFTKILNSPSQYGFVDATSYGNSGSFWGNNYHPSSAAHKYFAQDVAGLLSGTVW